VKVTDPSGQTWRISRRWLPWRQRLRDVRDFAADMSSPDFGDDLVVGLAIWAVVIVIAIVAPILLSLLFLPLEFMALVLVLPLAILGRILFGRKWHVELRRGWGVWCEVAAGDWRGSTMKIHEIADAVRRGEIPERTLGVNATT